MAVSVEERERRWNRTVGIGGIAFAVFFVFGWLAGGDTPDYDAADQEWLDWFGDSDNRGQQVVSAFAMTLAGLLLLPFVAGIVRRLRGAGADPEGTTLVVLGAGVLLAALTIVGGVLRSSASLSIEFAPDFGVPGADVLRMVEQLGIGVGLLGGGWAAALLVAATTWSARGTGALPGWLSVSGYVVAVLLLASVTFVAMALLPLWAIAVSLVLPRGARTPEPA